MLSVALSLAYRVENMDGAEINIGGKIEWPDEYDYRETGISDTMKSVNLKSKEAIKKFVELLSVKNNVNFTSVCSVKKDFSTYHYYKCHHGTAFLKGKRITDTK